MRLKNKVAIVTGDSRGIGFATVEAFFERGSTVILTASCLPETKICPLIRWDEGTAFIQCRQRLVQQYRDLQRRCCPDSV